MCNKSLKIILVALVVLLGISFGCGPGADIRVGAVEGLMQINEAGLEKADSELKNIEQQIAAAREKKLKLEQVIAPALEWVELEESRAREFTIGSTRKTSVIKDELEQFKNDQYQVTKLEFAITGIGTSSEKISSVIEVTDLNTGETGDWETVDKNLGQVIAQLEKNGQTIVDNASLSVSLLEDVIEQWEAWEVVKISQETYSVTGYGLGWEEQITAGEWTYYKDRDEMIPADSESSALKAILSIKL